MAADEALALQWVAGLADRPANLVNLSDQHNERVCFIAGHTAVCYDKRTRKQTLLQGHRNAISCVAATEDRTLLVTADEGPDEPLLVFWDPASCRPLRTLRRPHARGVAALALSPDGSQMATLSAVAPGSRDVQELSLWDLRPLHASLSSSSSSSSSAAAAASTGGGADAMQPAATAEVPAGDIQARLCYNPSDPGELMSNGRRRAYFWRSQLPAAALVSYYSPPLRASDFRQDVGDFVASAFVPGSTQALTSTTDGDVVVWDDQGTAAPGGGARSSAVPAATTAARRAVKVMRLHGAAITHLGSVGGLVVTGGADGLVRFFDPMLRLCAWFEELDAGPVNCVSFATSGGGRAAAAAGMQGDRLVATAFVVSTSAGKLLAVHPDAFNNPPEPCCPGGCELLLEAPGAGVADLAAHPLLPHLLLLDSAHRRLLRWDLPSHACIEAKALSSEQAPQRLALSWDGGLVALGCGGGHVVLLRGDSLEEVAVLRHTRAPITRLCVSLSSTLVAAADEGGSVLLYGLLPTSGPFPRWDLVGKLAGAHRGGVVGLHFGEAPSGQTRLFSLGADGWLLEYDLGTAKSAAAGLRMSAAAEVAPRGAGAVPSCMCFAPPLPYYSHNSLDTLLLIADDGYKIRPFNPDAGAACATYLGPTFGGPLSKLLPFRCGADGGSTWLAYSTAHQVVGLLAWPLSCNPRQSMGVIAHPGEVRALALSYNGSKLVTLGKQGVMMAWDVSTSALQASSSAAQLPWEVAAATASDSSSEQWLQLVPDPVQLEELRDYFCYAQLRAQREQQQEQQQASTGAHHLTGRVPVALLPDLMRAAGYYPSAADVDALLAHVRFLAGVAPQQQQQQQQESGSDSSSSPAAAGSADASASRPSSSSRCQQQQQEAPPEQEDGGAAADWEDAGAQADSVDFSTFLMLYANHRPVADASQVQIEAAFRALGADTAAGALPVRQLLALLQQEGDALGDEELARVLQVLTGSPSLDADYVDARGFATDVLGFEVVA